MNEYDNDSISTATKSPAPSEPTPEILREISDLSEKLAAIENNMFRLGERLTLVLDDDPYSVDSNESECTTPPRILNSPLSRQLNSLAGRCDNILGNQRVILERLRI